MSTIEIGVQFIGQSVVHDSCVNFNNMCVCACTGETRKFIILMTMAYSL